MRQRPPLAPLIAIAIAATAVLLLLQQPTWLVGVPAAFVGAVASARYPVVAFASLFICAGAIGTLTAFTPIRVIPLADFVLLALLLGVIGSHLFSSPKRRTWFWPGLLAPALYLLVSLIQVPLAEPVELGFYSFRATAWYMLAFFIVVFAPWTHETLTLIAKAAAAVALLVGAYSTFRWATGVSADEYLTQRAAAPRLDDRFAGSFLSANQLSGWCGTVIPFCLAMSMAWRGRWRAVCLGAIAFLTVALLVSDVRAGVAAAVIGVLVVLLAHQLAPSFPGRLGVGLLALTLVLSVGAGGYFVAVEGSPREDRLESLLNPGEDVTYSQRLLRWETALDVMSEEPLGLGLGTVGEVAVARNEAGSAVNTDLDSSYLKIGLEQGVVIMLLFVVGLLGVFIGTFFRSVSSRDPVSAAMGIGACGSLAGLMVLFYGGLYIEGMTVVVAWILIGLGVAAVTSREPRRAIPLREDFRQSDNAGRGAD